MCIHLDPAISLTGNSNIPITPKETFNKYTLKHFLVQQKSIVSQLNGETGYVPANHY